MTPAVNDLETSSDVDAKSENSTSRKLENAFVELDDKMSGTCERIKIYSIIILNFKNYITVVSLLQESILLEDRKKYKYT